MACVHLPDVQNYASWNCRSSFVTSQIRHQISRDFMKTQNETKELKLKAIKAIPKTGVEKISFENIETKYSFLNFWQWSVSDILSNTTRGCFAEFIVGTAIDLDVRNLRNEWDAYDLTTNDGIKIEIKSAS